MHEEPHEELPESPGEDRSDRARRQLTAIVVAAVAAGVAFQALVLNGLEHTSAVFIGVPAIIALLVIAMPRPKSTMGVVLKATTLALTIAAIALGEALVCVLFAAPIIYFIAIVTTGVAGFVKRRRGRTAELRCAALAGMVLFGMSLEGTVPALERDRNEQVTAVADVHATAEEVEAALARTPDFGHPLPPFLRLGFPTPIDVRGAGSSPGSARHITFSGAGHHPGTLTLRVHERGPGRILFLAESDDSYVTHWLSWRSAEVRWAENVPGVTTVEWTLSYSRRLDPAWYFGPLERHGVRVTAKYLIEALVAAEIGQAPALARR